MNGAALDVAFGNPDAPITIQSRKVVVALPPAVMADNIVFAPPLDSAKMQKSRQTATWCGDWVKIALECKSPFWRETGSSGIVATSGPIEVFWEGGPSSLVGLGVGTKATAFARDADEAKLRRFAIETLGAVFPRLQEELVAVHIHAWASEKETYSATGRERDYGHALLREPAQNGVHFAGTETERKNGHAEGAIVAGKRAAREVIEALRADICEDQREK
jgi:monoamine oxidase